MSLRMIQAVHDSRIEPRLRHLAQTLAVFANDDGGEIWPGVTTLKKALGVEERAVHEGLQALIERQVLERDGYHRHTRRFKFNLSKLTRYEPRPDQTRAAKREAARRREARRRTPKPCTTVQGFEAEIGAQTLHSGANNPAVPCGQPCTTVRPTLHSGALRSNERPERQETKTRASRAAHPRETKPKTDENTRPDVRVLTAIARRLFAEHGRLKFASVSEIAETLKCEAARQGVQYDGQSVRKAIDSAEAIDRLSPITRDRL